MTLILLSTVVEHDVEVSLSPAIVAAVTSGPTIEVDGLAIDLGAQKSTVWADTTNPSIRTGKYVTLSVAEVFVDTIAPTVELLKPSQNLDLSGIKASVVAETNVPTVTMDDDSCSIGNADAGASTKNPYVSDGSGIESIGQGTQLSPEDVIKSVFDRTNNAIRLSFAGTSSDVYDHSSDVGQILKAVFDPDTDTIRVVEV